jgi:hypothetical protein
MTFEEATRGLPEWAINARPPNASYSAWHLVEHLRLTQLDMLDYVRDPAYEAPVWPRDYWPDPASEATPQEYRASVAAFLSDRQAFVELLRETSVDVVSPIPHAPEHSVARCARVIANHNSYHVGELGAMRQIMASWDPEHR